MTNVNSKNSRLLINPDQIFGLKSEEAQKSQVKGDLQTFQAEKDFSQLQRFVRPNVDPRDRQIFLKQTRKNIKELESELKEQRHEFQELQNLVVEYVDRAEERMNNLEALISYQKESLANYLSENSREKEEKKLDLPTHVRPDSTKWWKRKPSSNQV